MKCAQIQVRGVDSAMEKRWKKICLDVVDEVPTACFIIILPTYIS